MKRRERIPASPRVRGKARHGEDDSAAAEREELVRRQAQLDQAAPADTPDGLIVSNPGPSQRSNKPGQ